MTCAPLLYVEDEEDDTFFMRRTFSKLRLQVPLRVVPDGRAAIDYLTGAGAFTDRDFNPLPGLVLLDLNLPGLSGFEVLEWIRAQPGLRTLPVVVCSASNLPANFARARALGADEFVVKPIDLDELAGLVRRLVARWLEPRAPHAPNAAPDVNPP